MSEYRTISRYNPANLIAGEFPIVTQNIMLAAGQNLNKGALLGRTSKGDYVLSNATATDGSEFPIAVLAEDVNASECDIPTVCYLSGQFNTDALYFGKGHTPASVSISLRLLNIYLSNLA